MSTLFVLHCERKRKIRKLIENTHIFFSITILKSFTFVIKKIIIYVDRTRDKI